MKRFQILHIVTSVEPAYGGPGSVARDQVRSLAAMGHDVTLVSTSDHGRVVDSIPDARSIVFPTGAFSRGIAKSLSVGEFVTRRSPLLATWLSDNVHEYEVVHVHFGREWLPVSAARIAASKGIPYVLQTHGMISHGGVAKSLVDLAWVRKCLERANAVLALQSIEERELRKIAADAKIMIVPNGIDLVDYDRQYVPRKRNEVIFAGRLHPRKRVVAFILMAAILVADFPDVKFSVVGADEGDLAAAQAAVVEQGIARRVNITGALPREEVLARLKTAACFVSPAVDEPFGMTTLEAMSVGTPCVVTESAALGAIFREFEAALVTDGTPEGLAGAVRRVLLDRSLAHTVTRNAREVIQQQFSIQSVARRLEAIYTESIGDPYAS